MDGIFLDNIQRTLGLRSLNLSKAKVWHFDRLSDLFEILIIIKKKVLV